MQEKDSEKLLNKIWWQIYAGVNVLSLHKFGILYIYWPYGAGYRLGLSLSCFPFIFFGVLMYRKSFFSTGII